MIYGRIYKIYCNKTGECYYGSTEKTLSIRLRKHKANYKQWKKGKHNYTTSFKIIERGNFTISILEEGEFQNTTAMEARECYYITNFECVNKVVPTRTKKEWVEVNIERILEQKREYYQANIERILEQNRAYKEANREEINEKHNCECGGKYKHSNKSHHFKTKIHQNYLANK